MHSKDSKHAPNVNTFLRRNTRTIDRKSDQASQAGLTAAAQNLVTRTEEERLRIPKSELRYLLTGLIGPEDEIEERPNPVESFLSMKVWQQVLELATMDHFDTLPDEIEKHPVMWRKFV